MKTERGWQDEIDANKRGWVKRCVISGAKHGIMLFIFLMLWCGVMVTMESYYLIEDKMPYAVAGFFLYPALEFIERIFKK